MSKEKFFAHGKLCFCDFGEFSLHGEGLPQFFGMTIEDILSRKIVIEKTAEEEMERTGGEEGNTEGKWEDVVALRQCSLLLE